MKTNRLASFILFASCFFLAGCGHFGVPDWTRHDEVPPEIKEQPRLVEVPPPMTDATYPRLGDVPFKPEDFSPKPVYEHYMNEMEFDRDSARQEKNAIEQEAPAVDGAGIAGASALVAPKLPGK